MLKNRVTIIIKCVMEGVGVEHSYYSTCGFSCSVVPPVKTFKLDLKFNNYRILVSQLTAQSKNKSATKTIIYLYFESIVVTSL